MRLEQFPCDLPVPEDDGAAKHLTGMSIPDIILKSTSDDEINLKKFNGNTVIYIYPMTGRPDTPLPQGWDSIPGARGCTPQSCSFRDLHADLKKHANIFGLSSQDTDYQREVKSRLHLPFDLLSDSSFLLKYQLSLPTFVAEGVERYKRITLIINNNVIKKVFYPIFPPDQNAAEVLAWFEK